VKFEDITLECLRSRFEVVDGDVVWHRDNEVHIERGYAGKTAGGNTKLTSLGGCSLDKASLLRALEADDLSLLEKYIPKSKSKSKSKPSAPDKRLIALEQVSQLATRHRTPEQLRAIADVLEML
jgi:hypothetical protein